MKADIIYLISRKEGNYFQKLINETGKKFREMEVIEDKIPPHLTLKYPFEINNLKELEKMLIKFTKKRRSANFKINGFDHYRNSVIFAKPELSIEAINLQKDLLNFLKEKGIKSHNYDIPFKPHITIVKTNKIENFNKIWSYLKEIKAPVFNLKLDNITIVREKKEDWEVYKSFKLK